MLRQLLNHCSPHWAMSASASFSLFSSAHPFDHNIRPQILVSARYEKRSCYGISLVLAEKAEKSEQGCLGPWRWWGRGSKADRGCGVTLGTSTCSHSVQGSGSGSPSVPECGALAGFLWRHAIVSQEFFVPAARFCRPAGGRGRSLVSQPRPSVEVAQEVAALGDWGPVLAGKGRVPNGWDREDAGMSLVRLLKKLKPLFLSPSASLSPPFLPAHHPPNPPSSPLSTLDHLHQVDIRRVYSGVCNCILSPVLHYQPWKWNLIILDQFLMYKMIWPRFKGSHNWNQVNDTCRFFFFFFSVSPCLDLIFLLGIQGNVAYFYMCMCVYKPYKCMYILCTYIEALSTYLYFVYILLKFTYLQCNGWQWSLL